jgi:hypothetical protein
MDKDIEAKLATALHKRQTATTEAELKKAADDKILTERQAQKDSARERWTSSLQEIAAAVASVNLRIQDHGLKFKVSEKSDASAPAIAQLQILLRDEKMPDDQRRRLVLNVSAFGLVQPVALGPHTLGNIADFKIEEADQGKYEQILADYIALLFK